MSNSSKMHPVEQKMLDMSLNEIGADENMMMFTKMKNFSGPVLRNYLQRKSMDAMEADNHMESIYYATAALSIWNLYKYENVQLIGWKNVQVAASLKRTVNDDLVNFCVNETDCNSVGGGDDDDTFNREPQLNDRIELIKRMVGDCNRLPVEWTVVQLTRHCNPMRAFQLKDDILTSEDPIQMTAFCYANSDMMQNLPFTVQLVNSLDVYQHSLMVSKKIVDACKNIEVGDVDGIIKENCEKIRKLLGHWIVLLSGKAKNVEAKNVETFIRSKVEQFCGKQTQMKFSNCQKMKLHLIARRLDLLDKVCILSAVQEILEINPANNVTKMVFEFLIRLKESAVEAAAVAVQYFPVILILEDTLDFMNWEMCIPAQETSRISSLIVLFKLFEKYRKNISNGYYHLSPQKGYVLLNPDSSLVDMEARMSDFYRSWLKHFKITSGIVPAPEEILEQLGTSDVYIYSGHGSSLQYLNQSHMTAPQTSCVMFLMGCDSSKIKSLGLQSEMFAPALRFHFALSPAVIGNNNLVTDFWADILTIRILSYWIPNNGGQKNYAPPRMELWLNNRKQNRLLPIMPNTYGATSSLLEILSQIRCQPNIPLRIRAILICRGLPVSNKNKG